MSRRRFRRQKLPTEAIELDVTGLSHEGRGIAHIDGKVAFVDLFPMRVLLAAGHHR